MDGEASRTGMDGEVSETGMDGEVSETGMDGEASRTGMDGEVSETRAAIERAAKLLGFRARPDVALGPFTTYRVGGRAALFVEVQTYDDLTELVGAVTATGLPTLAIGNGSNLLVAEAGFDGIAFRLGEGFLERSIGGPSSAGDGTVVSAGAAASLPVLARFTVAHGLTGFEWAVGVPGSVGGAVRMNAGGHGSDMAASLARVRVVDLRGGEDVVVPASRLQLSYRRSSLRASQVVVTAELTLRPGDVASGESQLAEIVRWRRANQPGGQNAGSVFTNPPGESAGRLIDAVGARGLRLGTAQVSTKHANFIQADEGGSADDVFALMGEVRRRVLDSTGVELVPETHLVGFR